ncbi:MAG: hypothetical protein ACRD07_12095 [Acidimicrobiales bacterium]
MRYKRLVAAAVAGIAATGWLAATPAGAQEFLPIEISPTSGPPGTQIAISGDGCIAADTPGFIGVFLFFEEEEEPVLVFGVEVADDGSWSAGILSEDTDPLGLYDVTATCFVGPESEEVIAEYDFATFELTAPPSPPSTAPPATPTPTPAPVAPQAPPATPVTADPTFTG